MKPTSCPALSHSAADFLSTAGGVVPTSPTTAAAATAAFCCGSCDSTSAADTECGSPDTHGDQSWTTSPQARLTRSKPVMQNCTDSTHSHHHHHHAPTAAATQTAAAAGMDVADYVTVLADLLDSVTVPSAPADAPTVYDAKVAIAISMCAYLDRWVGLSGANEAELACTAYVVDRFVARTGIKITPHNRHRVLLSALLVVQKVSRDTPLSATTYAAIGGVAPMELRRLEAAFLSDCDWRVIVSAENFDRYTTYFAQHHAVLVKAALHSQ